MSIERRYTQEFNDGYNFALTGEQFYPEYWTMVIEFEKGYATKVELSLN